MRICVRQRIWSKTCENIDLSASTSTLQRVSQITTVLTNVRNPPAHLGMGCPCSVRIAVRDQLCKPKDDFVQKALASKKKQLSNEGQQSQDFNSAKNCQKAEAISAIKATPKSQCSRSDSGR